MVGQCEYPGCHESASIACCMIGCNHKVCETHGNCCYEVTPDEVIPVCWYCCGKGWEDEEFPSNLLTTAERINQEDQEAVAFYNLMAEAQ